MDVTTPHGFSSHLPLGATNFNFMVLLKLLEIYAIFQSNLRFDNLNKIRKQKMLKLIYRTLSSSVYDSGLFLLIIQNDFTFLSLLSVFRK